jgi:hypothetical protein
MSKRVAGPRTPAAAGRPLNRLLAALPPADYERLRPLLRTVPTKVKQILHRRNEAVREVFFLNGGVASITTVMTDGAMVEIATVGDEGLIGMGAFFGGEEAATETMIQEVGARDRGRGVLHLPQPGRSSIGSGCKGHAPPSGPAGHARPSPGRGAAS